MSDEITTTLGTIDIVRREAFDEGIRYALDYLSDIFEGINETDIWADVYGKGNNE
jgi:hypothetical protein